MWGCGIVCEWIVWTTVLIGMFALGRLPEVGEFNGQCDGDNDAHDKEARQCPPHDVDAPRLVAVPPIKVGYVEELYIDPRRTLYRKTLSLKPVIFEIADFLTPEECEHIKRVAKHIGIQPSVTYNNGFRGSVKVMDIDGDKRLDVSEMRLTLENSYDIYFSDADVLTMYEELKLDQDNDGVLTAEELGPTSALAVEGWLRDYTAAHPTTQSRLSQQVWLYADRVADPTLRAVQHRVAALTGLAPGIVGHSDVQVVKYGVDGHYHAHWDSSALSGAPCCSPTVRRQCRICRFMTILFYLNDVEGGGGTAFPVADNATLDTDKLRRQHLINLREHCDDANLVVAPSLGKAVMWYNHDVDDVTGWMGILDEFSWHGGCPVTRGEKWIANFWVKLTEDRDADIKRMDL